MIFFEPTRLYRLFRQPVEDSGEALPLDNCFMLRDGSDVHPGKLGEHCRMHRRRPICSNRKAVTAGVIDVATLKPLDMNTILASVAKTGRCGDRARGSRTGGVGAEIAANIAERGLYSLLARAASHRIRRSGARWPDLRVNIC